MSEPVTCPQCGARNPDGAEWCNQCFSRLEVEAPHQPKAQPEVAPADGPLRHAGPAAASPSGPPRAGPVPPPAPTSAGPGAPPGMARPAVPPAPPGGPPSEADDVTTWLCRVCETANPLTESTCSACGASIYQSFGAEREEGPTVAPAAALRLALLLPGLGHAKAGQGLLGMMLGVVMALSLIFGISLVALGRAPLGWLLILIAVGVYLVGAMDAYRWAQGRPDEVLLRPRVLVIVFGFVFAVLLVATFQLVGQNG